MIKRTEKLVVTFYTTAAAMAMETVCKTLGITGRLIPVPASITADCGLAWCGEKEIEAELLEQMTQHKITPQGVYHCLI